MATQTLNLTNAGIGTLTAIQFSHGVSAADIASVSKGVSNDQLIISVDKGPSASTIQGGIIFGGETTTAASTLTSVSIASPSGATIASIAVGQQVYGYGIAPGTTVQSVGTTTLGLSSAPLTAQSSGYFIASGGQNPSALVTNGLLTIPNRGQLKLLDGDVVATGPSGEVIVVPALAINFPGSPWTLT